MTRPIITWLLITIAATHDATYAWTHRHTITQWELNPIALATITTIGLTGLLAFKAAGIILAATTAALLHERGHPDIITPITATAYTIVTCAYLL